MPDNNVYILGYQSDKVLKLETTTDSITEDGTITNDQYQFITVINNNAYSISELNTKPVLKLIFEESCTLEEGKFFPIVIETDESTLEDKFSPSTLFRVKFRLANRRKGIK